ncbi:MAG: DUF4493 domain-containing protein [Bacteroidales bacterium]|nr:DUF4493 domain-containing protein [Bacteroidales bacterium]
MKKIIILIAAAAALMLSASCQKSPVSIKEDGYLSFGGFILEVDETVITKAEAAGDNYSISIYDADEDLVLTRSYAEVVNNNGMLSLPAGHYKLVAASSAGEVPYAAFENPIYGVTHEFDIAAGAVTEIGELVCTLVQCKVTVSYSDEFLASVTGTGKTSVEVKAGYPLDFQLDADGTYDRSAGYFAVDGNTMTVVFQGNIDGKNAKMTKTFTGIAARQWRQIRFVQKKNEQGQATFDIEIQDLISDSTLNNVVDGEEPVIGEDPDAPKGDGGITLLPDYEAGCDASITDLTNMVILPTSQKTMSIKLRATIPGGIKKFNVQITTTNNAFAAAVAAASATDLDLISPLPENDVIFKVVPFPHGSELVGKTDVAFDLSAAQGPITAYKGSHTFIMTIVDQEGCRKQIPVTMVVE